MTRLLELFEDHCAPARFAILSIAIAAAAILIACSDNPNPSEAPAEAPPASTQTQTGQREIPVSGSLLFPDIQSLAFESPGIVGEVLVSEGDAVQVGQRLASLDAQSVAQLETAVAQARLRVTTAENQLNSLNLDSPLLIANAEAEVARAEVTADEAQKTLEDLRQRPGINSESAQVAVAQAEISLDDARERLEELLTPKQIAVSSAEARVAAARVELDSAQEAYDDIKDGSFPEEVLRDARNRASIASTSLETAKRTRTDAQAAAQNALTQSQDAEYLAREQYIAIFKYWFGAHLTDTELQMTPQEIIADWGIDLDDTFRRFNPIYTEMSVSDDPDTRWYEPTIWAWMNLLPQFDRIVPTCADEDPIHSSKRCITRELENAYDALDIARDTLVAARNNVESTGEQTNDAVSSAEAALMDAQDDLEDVEDGPEASAIESAQKRLQLAQASLQEAEDDLAELTVDIDPLNIRLARAALAQAEVTLEEAHDALDRSNDDNLYIKQANKQLELASAALRDAEVNLDASVRILQNQITAAEAELALAQAALDEADEAFDGAFLRSPIDGIVSIVNIEVDDPVSDELTAIQVVTTSVIEIDGVIDAAGRPFVSEGASAVVNIESLGDADLGGTVSFIGKEARTERGVISYAVRIRVEIPPGVNVPVILSPASAVIIVNESARINQDPFRYQSAAAPAFAAYRIQADVAPLAR